MGKGYWYGTYYDQLIHEGPIMVLDGSAKGKYLSSVKGQVYATSSDEIIRVWANKWRDDKIAFGTGPRCRAKETYFLHRNGCFNRTALKGQEEFIMEKVKGGKGFRLQDHRGRYMWIKSGKNSLEVEKHKSTIFAFVKHVNSDNAHRHEFWGPVHITRNQSDRPATITVNITVGVQRTKSSSHSESIAVGVAATMKTFGGNLETTVSTQFSSEWSKTVEEGITKKLSVGFSSTVQPGRAVAYRQKCVRWSFDDLDDIELMSPEIKLVEVPYNYEDMTKSQQDAWWESRKRKRADSAGRCGKRTCYGL